MVAFAFMEEGMPVVAAPYSKPTFAMSLWVNRHGCISIRYTVYQATQ